MFVVSLFCWSKPVEIWILRAKRTTRVNTVQSDGALPTSGGGARIKMDLGCFITAHSVGGGASFILMKARLPSCENNPDHQPSRLTSRLAPG